MTCWFSLNNCFGSVCLIYLFFSCCMLKGVQACKPQRQENKQHGAAWFAVWKLQNEFIVLDDLYLPVSPYLPCSRRHDHEGILDYSPVLSTVCFILFFVFCIWSVSPRDCVLGRATWWRTGSPGVLGHCPRWLKLSGGFASVPWRPTQDAMAKWLEMDKSLPSLMKVVSVINARWEKLSHKRKASHTPTQWFSNFFFF